MTQPRLLPVPGFEGVYEIDEFANVYSVVSSKFISSRIDKDGYAVFTLYSMGKQYARKAHRLVAMAFIGAAPDDKQLALHNDGDVKNNHYSNIRWGNASENQKDSIKHGTHYGSSKTHCGKGGHELSGNNLYIEKNGKRSCKKCRKEASRKSVSLMKKCGLPANSDKHGTVHGYMGYGCRCESCVNVNSEWKKNYRKGLKNDSAKTTH